jgi:hypothetical protein
MGAVTTERAMLVYRKRAAKQYYTDDKGEKMLLCSISLSVYLM